MTNARKLRLARSGRVIALDAKEQRVEWSILDTVLADSSASSSLMLPLPKIIAQGELTQREKFPWSLKVSRRVRPTWGGCCV